jgi:phosphohistidine swiveling domain-containing protein
MLRTESQGAYKTESDFTRVFSIATAPVHQSFINLVEIDLLKIILGKFKEKLEDYQQRYYWTKNNYFTAQNLSVKHFKEEVASWKKSGKDLNLELSRIENTPIRNRQEKQKLLSQFKLSPLLKTLLVISEDFTWWQDDRKRATYLAIEMGSRILEELGKRLGYTLLELKYALPDELGNIIKTGQPTPRELKGRGKKCLFIMNEKGFYVRVGKSQERLVKGIVLGKQDVSAIMDFRGLSASTGRAVGRVKIVKSATEIAKVKKGDILVAVMTRPDYVVAMKKVAAIVTNEGGITSHAAIVSRELGIPCIIGTKIATEVLKDGDLVEVNANHGWVRKLSRL